MATSVARKPSREKTAPVSAKTSDSKAKTKAKAETSEKKDSVKKEKRRVKLIEQFMSRFTKDTTGTLRFQAIGSDGTVKEQSESEIFQLYIRRTSPAMQHDPRYLKVTVEVLDKLPGSTVDEDEE